MLARILPLSRSNVPTRSTMTRISWATPKMYSRSERLNCLTEMMSLPYQGAERWSPKGRWGFFVGLGISALLLEARSAHHPTLRAESESTKWRGWKGPEGGLKRE